MQRRLKICITLVAILTVLASDVAAQSILLFDTFESGSLSQWTGKPGQAHHGTIVADPLNATNHVLTFTGLNTGGDIYSAEIPVLGAQQPPRSLILSFDFLGLPLAGATPPEYGGFVGIDIVPGEYYWLAATYLPAVSPPPSPQVQLVADGSWHHYEIDLTPLVTTLGLSSVQVMLEDWADRGSVPGDVYFDNVKVALVAPQLSIRVSQVELCWDTLANTVYEVQYSSSLTTNVWRPLVGAVVGDGSRLCVTDVVLLDQPQKLYRVIVKDSP